MVRKRYYILPLTLNISVISSSISTINDSYGILMTRNLSLIFEFDEELTEIIDIEKDEDNINFWKITTNCLQPQISQPKLHQIKHVGGVSESSWSRLTQADNIYWFIMQNFCDMVSMNKIVISYDAINRLQFSGMTGSWEILFRVLIVYD